MSYWSRSGTYLACLIHAIRTNPTARTIAVQAFGSFRGSLATAIIAFIPVALFVRFAGGELSLVVALFSAVYLGTVFMRLFGMLLHKRQDISIRSVCRNYLLTIWLFTVFAYFTVQDTSLIDAAASTVMAIPGLLFMGIMNLGLWRYMQTRMMQEPA